MVLDCLPPGDPLPRSQQEEVAEKDVTTGAKGTVWGLTERRREEKEATPLLVTNGNAVEVSGLNACFMSLFPTHGENLLLSVKF